jgi:putative YphP/YqiW family bacilliredoxin
MFNIQSRPPIYDPEAVQPMRDELVYCGFEELTTPQKVDEVVGAKNDETVLVMINSVCGCAAGSARPGVTQAVQNELIPDRIATIFAGQDRDAVDHFRQTYMADVAPSSPSIALFKNGEILFSMPRLSIEGRYPDQIAEDLVNVFNNTLKNKVPLFRKRNMINLFTQEHVVQKYL